jgi:spore photoproduct lyase
MSKNRSYSEKFERIAAETTYAKLPPEQQIFLSQQAHNYQFTQQEFRQLVEISIDLNQWDEAPLQSIWPTIPDKYQAPKDRKRHLINALKSRWQQLKDEPTRYTGEAVTPPINEYRIQTNSDKKDQLGLGYCPVASEKTRCCNLLTLDAVDNCGFDCSYCSIQSFYHNNQINFDSHFSEKLQALEIDPEQHYHIGTGQSSDSLMWGNRHGILDALFDFARRHPNVILELKTKSKNISYLMQNELPANILFTWSLNTPTIIVNEEHLAATLDERLNAARQVADKGGIVGFHLHPMVFYHGWEEEYSALFEQLLSQFKAEEVALISLGTLTYIKSVIKQIRGRDFKSKILQMPLTESDGKLSYPEETKLAMFKHAYQSLQPWHEKVFFYLCMENQRLWQPIFGYEYESNQAFEKAMKEHYLEKIKFARDKRICRT